MTSDISTSIEDLSKNVLTYHRDQNVDEIISWIVRGMSLFNPGVVTLQVIDRDIISNTIELRIWISTLPKVVCKIPIDREHLLGYPELLFTRVGEEAGKFFRHYRVDPEDNIELATD